MRYWYPFIIAILLVIMAGCTSPESSDGSPGPVSEETVPATFISTHPSAIITATPSLLKTTVKTVRTTPTPTPPCAKLSTGTSLLSSPLTGSKYLTIDNQNDYDAVITLRISSTPPQSGRKVISFYLQANDQYTIRNIGPGSYTLWYKLGECWDPERKIFLVNISASRFDDILDYTPNTAGFSAKIYGVVDGNAPTTKVPFDQV